MLLMALMAPWAMAQQALPYSYGFEDADLSTDGWTNTGGGISNYYADGVHSGSYYYYFSYSSADVYLVSPLLTGGDNGIDASFYYKSLDASYLDHFQVGYTTDANNTDPTTFTYGSLTTASTEWQQYDVTLPAGTVRVAVYYDGDNYDDGDYLALDDFSFEAASDCEKPETVVAENIETTSVTINWTGGSGKYNVEYKADADDDWTVRITNYSAGYGLNITNLTPGTSYQARVQSVCDSKELSGWKTVSFKTECGAYEIPYTYGFEDAGDMDCWARIDCEDDYTNYISGRVVSSNYAHTGSGFYAFSSYNGSVDPPQYFVSPQLTGITDGLHVEFWYRGISAENTETFRVGYSTTGKDMDNDFTWGDEIVVNTADYIQFKANYPAATKYIAVKYTSDFMYYLLLDDFLFEEAPSCVEPTNITFADITTTSATVSFTAAAGRNITYDIYVTDDSTDVPDAETTATYNSNTMSQELSELTAGTLYYVYLRTRCNATDISDWSTFVTFSTACVTLDLPNGYDFENGALSPCWTIVNENPSYNNVSVKNTNPYAGNYNLDMRRGSPDGIEIIAFDEIASAYALTTYEVLFYAKSYSDNANYTPVLTIGFMEDPTDETTFVAVGDPVSVTTDWAQYEVRFDEYAGTGRYFAIQHSSTAYGNTYIDNIELTPIPACDRPTDLAVDGGKNAVITWVGTAGLYEIAFATSSDADPEENIIADDVTENEFDLASYTVVGDNYVWVRANCGTDGYSSWVGTSFNVGYCVPAPTSRDGQGITGVAFGTDDIVNNSDTNGLPSSSPYYGDYTSMVGSIAAGTLATVAITTSTSSYPYTFVIWVDWDNSYSFEDSEVVYVGKCASGSGTLEATFTVPATQALGDYRMRIYGADSYFTNFYGNGTTNWSAAHDPCVSGTWMNANDYTLRVTEAPACIAPSDLTAIVASDSAELSWTANSGETSWTLYWKAAADADYTMVENVEDNPYLLEGLTPSTNYMYYVVANCSASETSEPSAVYTFKTPCSEITALPWTETFEGMSASITPDCWDISASTSSTASGSSYYYVWGTYSYNNNMMMRMNNYFVQSGTAIINTPVIVLGADEYAFTFDYAHNASCGDFTVKISTDGGNTFTDLQSYSKGSGSSYTDPGEFTPASISLAAYSNQSIIIQFYATANYGNGAIFVDNLRVGIPPTCQTPTALDATTTSNTAELAWTSNSGETEWTIYYKVSTDADYTMIENVEDNPYLLEGLTPSTTYKYYVVANCSETDSSDPSQEFTFTTQCEDFVVDASNSFFESFEGTWVPTCWTSIPNGTRQWTQNSSYSVTGSKCAYSGYYGDIYLVLPDLAIANDPAPVNMTFQSRYNYIADYDRSSVVLIDGDNETELWAADDSEIENGVWYETTIDLSAYVGQTISLAFKYEGNNAHAWYVDDVAVAFVAGTTQTTDLVEGWNWFSTYIAVDDPVDMLDMLKASLGTNADEIQSFLYSTEFDGEEWFGDLDDEGIFNNETYLIYANTDCTVELSGTPAVVTEYSITINPGWNWIGFPSADGIEVADAMFNFNAYEGDMMQTKENSTEFDGDEWFGDLETFVPGEGVMYFSNDTDSKTLIFATGAKKAVRDGNVLDSKKDAKSVNDEEKMSEEETKDIKVIDRKREDMPELIITKGIKDIKSITTKNAK